MNHNLESVQPGARQRALVIWAALLALFLGALDALIMSAAMPSIVAELGGLSLYAWVYSAYFLARAVSLPVFGKLADRYSTRNLFLFSITLFLVSSIAAGASGNMVFLILSRVFQGIGAGGVFALVYIVLSEVAPTGKRAHTLSLASSIWGISSVIGPTLGGFIVTYFSWRWIFFVNVPIGLLSLVGIAFFLDKTSGSADGTEKREPLDLAGIFVFSSLVLGLLTIFIIGGKEIAWKSLSMLALAGSTVFLGLLFYLIEKKADDPMINFHFFRNRNFSFGNGATFLASFTIFSFFAYVPLYIQGSLGLNPMQVGLAMVSLSLGWSFGALLFGRKSKGGDERNWSIAGGIILLASTLLTLRFNLQTTMSECFLVFFLVGIGMGIVSLSTLILVQNSVRREDLGITTSFHQFSRSLGGTIGVGICGGLVSTNLFRRLDDAKNILPQELLEMLQRSTGNLLMPEFQALVPAGKVEVLRSAVLSGVFAVFVIVSFSSFLCLLCCLSLSQQQQKE